MFAVSRSLRRVISMMTLISLAVLAGACRDKQKAQESSVQESPVVDYYRQHNATTTGAEIFQRTINQKFMLEPNESRQLYARLISLIHIGGIIKPQDVKKEDFLFSGPFCEDKCRVIQFMIWAPGGDHRGEVSFSVPNLLTGNRYTFTMGVTKVNWEDWARFFQDLNERRQESIPEIKEQNMRSKDWISHLHWIQGLCYFNEPPAGVVGGDPQPVCYISRF